MHPDDRDPPGRRGVDDILAVPGIDAVYIGPADLSLTYGLPPAVDNPGEPFDGALARVADACRRHGVIPGIHANASLAGKRHAAGFRMITVGFDAAPAIAAINADVTTRERPSPARAPSRRRTPVPGER